MGSSSSAPLPTATDSASQPADDNLLALPENSVVLSRFQLMQFGAICVFIGVCLAGVLVLLIRRPDPPPIVLQPPPTPLPTATPIPTPTPAPIVVYVSGAVAAPGLYTLPVDARVGDALTAAGGLAEDAATAQINQAERLWDGAQVHVPSMAEAAAAAEPVPGVSGSAPPPTPPASASATGRINVNTASAEELTSLPGIGPAKAEAIVANRPYASVDDLERVPGIGPKTVEQLRDLVTVGE